MRLLLTLLPRAALLRPPTVAMHFSMRRPRLTLLPLTLRPPRFSHSDPLPVREAALFERFWSHFLSGRLSVLCLEAGQD
jgi:hypothetical protein